MTNKLLLVDGSSLAFRAFFSILDLHRFKNQKGLHTNALYSFHRMLQTVLDKEQPTHVLVAWDAGSTTFRTQMYQEYKGGRPNVAPEFREQFPYFNVLLDAWGIAHYRLDQYEADDIIGTLSRLGEEEDYEVVVLSGDKDMIQLARPQVRVEITTKGVSELVTYTPETIMEKFGLTPDQIIDMKGLTGDSSDNYPGVTKVGEKTAMKLLQEYGTMEGIYESIDQMKASKLKENLINDKDQAFLSKTLARIDRNSPLEIGLQDTLRRPLDFEALMAFYKEMNFNSFQTELIARQEGESLQEIQEILSAQYEPVEVLEAEALTPDFLKTATVFYPEILEENYHVGELVGLGVGNEHQVIVLTKDQALANTALLEWLANPQIGKITYDLKASMVLAARYGFDLQGLTDDLSLLAYLIDTNDSVKEVADIAKQHDMAFVQYDELVYGKGAKLKLPEDSQVWKQHLAQKVQALALLVEPLKQNLKDKEQLDLYQDMEVPLAKVLAKMEIQGIRVDQASLIEMGKEFEGRLKEIESEIYALAGESFNINSPKQLGVILFEKMGLPSAKKTKTGYSTAVDVLEKLAPHAPIVASILEYRQLAKLKSTYVEGLQAYIQADGKIHTRYVQNLTQTGRLSSTDPNLQNIPIRTEEGRRIRSAFLPSQEGWKILSSDYSQIELRVLAHIAQDQAMIQAFKDGIDIHTNTAMKVFGLSSPDQVTSSMRREAKAVNFGIVYGISDYGLSQNLNISIVRAKEFIERYLEEFQGVKNYMTTVVAEGKEKGYVETLFKRRRYLPDLNAANFNVRSFAERTAMNSPIQGSAADILKMAMIKLDQEMTQRGFQARMLLQVHDELIFEVPEAEVAELTKLVESVMENTTQLTVPLKADSNLGNNWQDAK